MHKSHFKMTLISENNTVCTINNMGQLLVLILNFNEKYCMNDKNVYGPQSLALYCSVCALSITMVLYQTDPLLACCLYL